MKTFIIDWGVGSNGGRFAMIQADTIKDAWFDADMIGSPFKITELKIKLHDTGDGKIRYMEVNSPDEPYAGKPIEESVFNTWKESGDLL